jgi:hypothetical protein
MYDEISKMVIKTLMVRNTFDCFSSGSSRMEQRAVVSLFI